ncbi:MAG: transporter substrate-binding domain-containing protein [Marinobacter sp.]|uniref:substrate-binding periplasmic protein n=1 Tax=Marinobacter sp. TaxID=50741 RepID=UPI00299F1B7A|nr:transporter substrate-binding domain-containing protein [Marinobacter sp.]MDX1755677.1 transporter substrate-binding domain-containing protein [Marinobacter sp.]
MPALSRGLQAFVVTVALLLSAAAWASEATPAKGATADLDGILRLNVSPNGYPPYLIVEDHNLSGIIWDVVSRIAGRLEYDVAPIQIPRKRVDELVLRGYIDATPRAIEWTKQPERFLFTDPIVNVEEVFFYPANTDFRYQAPMDLEAKTIVTHLGYQYPALRQVFEYGMAERFDVNNDVDMFRYLLDGDRFDAAIADRLVGQWIIRNHPKMDGLLTATDNSVSNYGFRLMVRQDLAEFVDAFNAELAQLKASGELDRILSEYR